ncbi:hypothetical protein Tco_1304555 [Tanacetum coccineum]
MAAVYGHREEESSLLLSMRYKSEEIHWWSIILESLHKDLEALNSLCVADSEGTSGFSRLGKMEFPKFHGEDVKGWMFRVKQFFAIDAVGEADKIKLVSIHLYDRILTWHLQFVKTHNEAVTWAAYEEAVLKRFRDVNEDPMA